MSTNVGGPTQHKQESLSLGLRSLYLWGYNLPVACFESTKQKAQCHHTAPALRASLRCGDQPPGERQVRLFARPNVIGASGLRLTIQRQQWCP
jgi:hypothetical protein